MTCVDVCVPWDHAQQLARLGHPSLITIGLKRGANGKTPNTYVVLWAGHLAQVLYV